MPSGLKKLIVCMQCLLCMTHDTLQKITQTHECNTHVTHVPDEYEILTWASYPMDLPGAAFQLSRDVVT